MSDDKNTTVEQLILDSIKKISKNQDNTYDALIELTTEFKLHKQESQLRWETIEKLDKEQNEILAEHHARSTAIQKDVKLREEALRNELFGANGLEERVTKLEAPQMAKKLIIKWIITVGGIAGAITAILALLNKL